MSVDLVIGWWVEKEPREETAHTSYAADWIQHRIRPDRYPLRLSFEGGYLLPMPYWLLAKLESDVIDGRYYSGFGGLNFASREAEKGPGSIYKQLYDYQLPKLVETGRVELLPGFEWALRAREHVQEQGWTWDDISRMKATEEQK